MATTPTPTPAAPATPGPISKFFGHIGNFPGFAWVKAHEKLLIIIIVSLVAVHFWSTGIKAWENYESKNVATLQAQLDAAKTAADNADKQRLADAQTAAVDKAASTAQAAQTNAILVATLQAIKTRDAATQSQQQVDLHASIPQLSQRFSSLVPGVNPQDIVISPDQKTVTVGTDTAQKTVAQLEEVPKLQADLKDTQTEVTSLQAEIKSLQTYNSALETEVTTDDKEIGLLNTELAKASQTCDARIGLEQAKTKAAFLHGFKIGAILGFIGGLFLGHAAAGI